MHVPNLRNGSFVESLNLLTMYLHISLHKSVFTLENYYASTTTELSPESVPVGLECDALCFQCGDK